MPLVRIDVPAGIYDGKTSAIGDIVYEAMRATLNVPENDRFQIIAEHDRANLIIDPTYPGIERTDACIVVQVTFSEGRTLEQKRAFYKAVADGLHEHLDVRRQDVFISLVEVRKENWSFGNGEAQYAPA
jgi:4-oxalocrotonate tautomerase